MTVRAAKNLALSATAGIGLLCVIWWLTVDPVKDFTVLNPGMDNRPEGLVISAPRVSIGAWFEAFDGAQTVPGEVTGEWPRFRGSAYDNISRDKTALAESWPEGGPEILWSVALGEGHAGPVIANGRVYLLDYDEEAKRDQLRCFSFGDGSEIWRRGYSVVIKRNHGMSRTVPAVMGNRVLTIGPMCHVMCVDAESGDFEWGIDLVAEYGAEVPLWYTGQCPLIDDSVAVIAVGGEALMIGVDPATGEVLWKTPNPLNWKMSHSSVIPYTIHGRRMYIYCALGGVAGVSAEKEDAGKLLFASPLFNRNVIAPSPVYLGDGKLFVTAGYGGGSMLLHLANDGAFTVTSMDSYKPNEGLTSEQQTPLFYDEHLFGILPKDGGTLRNQFVCYHPDNVRKPVWSSGKTIRFGLGPYMVIDGKFFILSDDGILTMALATASAFTPLGQAKILEGHDAWGPMAFAGGRLLARDSRRMVCVDLRAR